MINNFTTTKIDFLNNIDKSISIDKSARFHYLKIYTWEASNIAYFLKHIKYNDVYTVFPFISTSGLIKDPYLRLSDHFLVTNKSDPELIDRFLNEQWINTDFNVECDKSLNLYFKIKRVTVSYDSF
jgi:hypothetical protein